LCFGETHHLNDWQLAVEYAFLGKCRQHNHLRLKEGEVLPHVHILHGDMVPTSQPLVALPSQSLKPAAQVRLHTPELQVADATLGLAVQFLLQEPHF
jgi:hypothetical protein